MNRDTLKEDALDREVCCSCQWAHVSRVLILVLLTYMCGYWSDKAETFASIQVQGKYTVPLDDLLFDILPDLSQGEDIFSAIAKLSTLIAMAFFVLLFFIHSERVLFFTRYCVLLCFLILFRCSTIIVVYPPPSGVQCTSNSFEYDWVWGNSLFFSMVACGHMLFSLQVSILILTSLFISYYVSFKSTGMSNFVCLALKTLSWLLTLVGSLTLLVTRKYYSSDIIISVYITVSAFFVYHHLVRPSKLLERNCLLQWIEFDAVNALVELRSLQEKRASLKTSRRNSTTSEPFITPESKRVMLRGLQYLDESGVPSIKNAPSYYYTNVKFMSSDKERAYWPLNDEGHDAVNGPADRKTSL